MNTRHVLVAIDDSPESDHAVTVAAQRVAERPDARVLLFHVLPTMPGELLEYGGVPDPTDMRRGLQELHEQRVAWMAEERAKAQPLYDRMTAILRDNGVELRQIETAFDAPNPECSIAREILRAAHDRHCGTVIVGYHSAPWHKELFHRHVGDQLRHSTRHESGLEVVVVGEACSV